MSHFAHVTQQQMDVYDFFKKFAKRNGRLPNVNEIVDGIKVSTPGQALYWAGCILLKGGFGLKVADGDTAPDVVKFGDFKFPMHNDAPAAVRAAPVAEAVIQANPVPAAASDDMPLAIRNLSQRIQKIKKEKAESHVEVMKRDVLSVMDQIKKFNIQGNLNSRLLSDTLKEFGKSYSPQQIGWAVHSLLKERKLKGYTGAFTYL
jgi:hypothetical protein